MRNNQPVTQKEQRFRSKEDLVSVTDLNGKIKYVNKPFIDISGFSEDELIGQDHNIVRHPDMPEAAFEDLWATVKSGVGWRGMVKNRCKNGDHYWVRAFVTPVMQNEKVIGYQSVRAEPSREQVAEAEKLYAKMRQDKSMKLPKPGFLQRVTVSASVSLASMLSLACMLVALVIGFQHASTLLTTMLIIAILSGAFVWWRVIYGVINPLNKLRFLVRDLAGGNYSKSISYERDDEVGRAFMAVKLLQARNKTILGQVMEATHELIQSAEQLSASSKGMLTNMRSQADHTTLVATAMNQMSATVEEVSSNAQSSADITTGAQTTVVEGDEVVMEALQAMQVFSEELTRTTAQVNQLSADSEQISNITNVISDIADQTNLLALNAAIEAARAGEQGRGFAVVADEVRGLASRTQDATQEIRTMLGNLSSSIQHSATTIEENNKEAREALEKVEIAREIFGQVAEGMELINDMSTQIATAAEEQAQVAQEMSRDIETISQHAGNTEHEAEELEGRAAAINRNAMRLQAQLSDFDLG